MRPCLPDDCSNSSSSCRFQPLGVDGHFAGGNLLLRGAVIAKLADAESLLASARAARRRGRSWAGKIQVAKPGERDRAPAQGSSLAKSSKRASASSDGSSRPVAGSPGKSSGRRSTDLRARSRTDRGSFWIAGGQLLAVPVEAGPHRADGWRRPPRSTGCSRACRPANLRCGGRCRPARSRESVPVGCRLKEAWSHFRKNGVIPDANSRVYAIMNGR